MIKKIQTGCCALCQLSISNDTPIEDISSELLTLRTLADVTDYNPSITNIGERAVFVITKPDETKLMANLMSLGFKRSNEFKRRKGYKQTGNLQMWFLNW